MKVKAEQIKVANKTFDYTTNMDRLRTVRWSTFCLHGVMKPLYGSL